MTLQNFTSVLEIFAVINFAYVASNDFVENLDRLLVKASYWPDKVVEELTGKLFLAKSSLISIETVDSNIRDDIQITKGQLLAEEKFFEDEVDKYKRKKSAIANTHNFVEVSLFGGLYALFLLFVNGLHEADDKNLFYESLLVYDILCVLFVAYIITKPFLKKKDNDNDGNTDGIGNLSVVTWFSVITIISCSVYVFNDTRCPYFRELSLNRIILMLSVLLPMSHFIFYFIRGILNRHYLMITTIVNFQNHDKKIVNLNSDVANLVERAHINSVFSANDNVPTEGV